MVSGHLISVSHYGNKSLTYFFSNLQVNNRVSTFLCLLFPLDRNFWHRMSLKHFLLKPIVFPSMLILVIMNILSLFVDFCHGRRPGRSAPSFRILGALGGVSLGLARRRRPTDAGVQTSGDARCSKSAELPLSVLSCHADL